MSASSDNKKSRGRPATTGTGQLIGVRLQPAELEKLDAWISEQADKPSRPEALRRLFQAALEPIGDLDADLLKRLDAWNSRQPEPQPTRQEALRTLIENARDPGPFAGLAFNLKAEDRKWLLSTAETVCSALLQARIEEKKR